ncbi:MAG: hypothetical protein A2W98_05340 [Bacteroidetes bacterium GWF2_33_38]|nr:MAG: hypothetical protein A2W98_05340 [Bacteroidetes bacterium GWF2_33_38]OFY92341.1 MAG: hypothetical protein A2236_01850 [Bacteroidetes bacterium RIFOXYA2_FULL_33_7]
MPYRRLPNTDKARQRALAKALQMGNEMPPFKLAFSQGTLQKARFFYPIFDSAIQEYQNAYNFQVKKNKEYVNLMKRAKLYISHFIQVLNFAIARGEVTGESRKYFGIIEDSKRLPSLNTEESMIKFGERIIKGEQERIANRNNPMTNPTIAVVRVHYEKWLEAYRYQKNLQEIHNRALQKIADMRHEADKIILSIWNEVEESFSIHSEDLKRQYSMEYGLVYVYRKSEKNKQTKPIEASLNFYEEEIIENVHDEIETEVLSENEEELVYQTPFFAVK